MCENKNLYKPKNIATA